MAIGGQGTIATDGTTAGRNVPDGAPSFLVGAGPCLRWPRLRASLTLDGAVRVKSIAALAATEVMWIFLEGYPDHYRGTQRTSLAVKGRLAGGWNEITNRRIAEAGIGLALVLDSYRRRNTLLGDGKTGDFHAVSLDLIATYASDRRGEDEVWLGGQVSYHFNGFSAPPSPGPIRGALSSGVRYNRPQPGQATDCNGGHLP
ncbi:MAG: hypothetical protein KBG48_02555 [Kofleriaceae bacterium]|nr:hypothetical protein [Kofleriaceae bacterium]MBP9166232.1 hypothetical protein [Kofleriaceae bacterium]